MLNEKRNFIFIIIHVNQLWLSTIIFSKVKTLMVSELVLIGNAKINESVISGLSIKIDKNKSLTNKII